MNLSDVLDTYPAGRVFVERDDGRVRRLHLYNAISRETPLDPLFAALQQTGTADDLEALRFECDWSEEPVPFDFSEITTLLAQHGPFNRLRQLTVLGESYLEPARLEGLEVLEDAAPNVEELDLDVPYGLGLSRSFRLDRLRSMAAEDFYLADLDRLTRCEFPELITLKLALDIDEIDDWNGARQTLERLFGGGFAPKLQHLHFMVFYREAVSDAFRALFEAVYEAVLEREALVEVSFPSILEGVAAERFERVLAGKLRS